MARGRASLTGIAAPRTARRPPTGRAQRRGPGCTPSSVDTFLKIVLLPPSPGARVVDATSRASGSPGPLTPRFAPRMGSRMQTIRASSRRGPGALSAGAGPQTTVYNCLGGECVDTCRRGGNPVRMCGYVLNYNTIRMKLSIASDRGNGRTCYPCARRARLSRYLHRPSGIRSWQPSSSLHRPAAALAPAASSHAPRPYPAPPVRSACPASTSASCQRAACRATSAAPPAPTPRRIPPTVGPAERCAVARRRFARIRCAQPPVPRASSPATGAASTSPRMSATVVRVATHAACFRPASRASASTPATRRLVTAAASASTCRTTRPTAVPVTTFAPRPRRCAPRERASRVARPRSCCAEGRA